MPKTVTVTATDPDNDPLTYTLVTNPTHGTITGTGPNWTYTPAANYNGPDSFTWKATDSHNADSNIATCTLAILPVNDPPTVDHDINQTVTDTNRNGTETVTLDGSASTDIDGSIATYQWTCPGVTIPSTPNPTTTVTLPIGQHQIILTVTDNQGATSLDNGVIITVKSPTNEPPTANAGPSQTLTNTDHVGIEVVILDGTASSDPDNNIATYTWTQNGTPLATGPNPTITLTPGIHTITLTVTDTEGLSDTDTVTITLTAENRPPDLSAIPATLAKHEGDTVTTAEIERATDPDNDRLTYTYTGWLSALPITIAAHATAATHTFHVEVSDGTVSASKDVTISVSTGENQSPQLDAIENKAVNEAETVAFTLTATDPDDDPLTYSLQNAPANATLNKNSGTFTWTPTYNDAGSHLFTCIASDGHQQVSQAVTITVNNVNRPPILTPIGNKNVLENTQLTFTIQGTDPDGDKVAITSQEALPAGASLKSGTFTWTPAHDDTGSYEVTFIANDGQVSVSESITIVIKNQNIKPEIDPITTQTVNEMEKLNFTVTASGSADDTITYTAENLPGDATFTGGLFTWTPGYDDAGVYTPIFTANDSVLQDSISVTITVNNVNRKPNLSPIANKSVAENDPVTFTLEAIDPDGDTLAYSAENLPENATLDGSTGQFSWTPSNDQAGSYALVFTASDSGNLSDSTTVTVTVGNSNQPPVIAELTNQTVGEGETLSFTLGITDPDQDTLTTTVTNLPANAALTGNTFTWTPDYDQAGSYSLTFTATDGELSDTQAVTITVTDTNRAPEIRNIPTKSAKKGKPLQFTIDAIDPDDDPVTLSAQGLPDGATLTDGQFSWRPEIDGPASYRYDHCLRW